MGAVGSKVNRDPFPWVGSMVIIPPMVVVDESEESVPSKDALAYAGSLGASLAILCVNAGRPDAAMDFLRAVLTLQRPVQLPEVNAADGDAA